MSTHDRIRREPVRGQDTGSFTRAIGPLFAAFSLPTIAQLVGERPIPWASIPCFFAGTRFLLAGYQFSITDLFTESVGVRKIRAFLTWFGMMFVVVGLGLLVVHMKGYFWAPLWVLWFVGLALPLICRYVAFPIMRRFARPNGVLGTFLGEIDTPSEPPSGQSEVLLAEIRDTLRTIASPDALSERPVD